MDLSTVARACLRRFYVVLVVVGLAGYAAAVFYRDAQPAYSVSASVVVVPSASLTAIRAAGPSANPFNATSGPTTLATLTAASLNTAVVQSTFMPDGAGLVAGWDSESGQLVTLTSSGGSVSAAQAAIEAAIGQTGPVLERIQVDAGTPVDQLYVASQGAPVDLPRQTYPDRLRTVVATVLAGVLVAVVLAVVLDSILLRRRASRHSAVGPAAGSPPGGRLPTGEGPAVHEEPAGSRTR